MQVGYYVWKPYVILKTLLDQSLPYNDTVVVWSDVQFSNISIFGVKCFDIKFVFRFFCKTISNKLNHDSIIPFVKPNRRVCSRKLRYPTFSTSTFSTPTSLPGRHRCSKEVLRNVTHSSYSTAITRTELLFLRRFKFCFCHDTFRLFTCLYPTSYNFQTKQINYDGQSSCHRFHCSQKNAPHNSFFPRLASSMRRATRDD